MKKKFLKSVVNLIIQGGISASEIYVLLKFHFVLINYAQKVISTYNTNKNMRVFILFITSKRYL